MSFLFALTIFVNAGLLFAVQPMVAKLLLPVLGGAPAVWNTCMVFFQSALLAGYALAHWLSTRLSLGKQITLFPILQLLTFASLPIQFSDEALASAPDKANPIPWLLGTLTLAVGLPFLVVSTTGTLLQKWFGSTRHPAAGDPYYLYSASNFGSMIALFSYPILIEPRLTTTLQTQSWAFAFGALVALTAVCAVVAFWRRAPVRPDFALSSPLSGPVSLRRRTRWVFLAFVPSSLMLGVTTYLTNDIGSIPLLWVIPLGLYLFSFTLAFSRRHWISRYHVARWTPIGVIILTLLLLADAMQPSVAVWLLLHLLIFFVLAWFVHGELATDRPETTHLTEFYLWIAVGGVLGGAFNALAAPLLFSRIAEYPIAVVLVCLVRWSPGSMHRSPLDWMLPACLLALTALLIIGARALPLDLGQLKVALMFGVPALLCYLFVDRPLRFALGIAAVFLAAFWVEADPRGTPLFTQRSFFGVLRVTNKEKDGHRYFQLVHGNTVHGRQFQNSTEKPKPLSYYHETGPIGHIFQSLRPQLASANIGVIGLGVGSMAFYAEPGQHWTFFEIDPTVKQIAEDSRFFKFLETSASPPEIILGDARLRLRDVPDAHFDLLVLDAFSSDAVPVHLLTREALQLYLSKLKPNGVLAFHISNRYLDLKPVLAALANDAGLWSRYCDDFSVAPSEVGKEPSQWVTMARRKADWGALTRGVRWFEMSDVPSIPVWTDDFSNVLNIVRWRPGWED